MVPIVGTVPTYMSLIQENGRRTHCAGTGGVATLLPRAVPRNVPRPPQLSGERRGAVSESFGESLTSCTDRGEFSTSEAFVP